MAEQREAVDLRRKTRVLQVGTGLLLVIIAVVFGMACQMYNLSVTAIEERGKATVASTLAAKEARLARAQQCAAVSGSTLPRNPVLASILAAEALHGLDKDDAVPQSVEQALRDAVAQCTGRALVGHSSQVELIAIDPNERWLATSALDEVFLWDLTAKPEELRPVKLAESIPPPQDENQPWLTISQVALAFANQGTRLLAINKTGQMSEWQLDGQPRLIRQSPWIDETSGPAIACFEPASRKLATCDDEGEIRVWNWPRDPAAPLTSEVISRGNTTVAFASGQPRLVTAGGIVQVWDCGDEPLKLRATLSVPDAATFSLVAISPDNRFVAAADERQSGASNVYVWDLEQGHDSPAGVRVIEQAAASYAHEELDRGSGMVTHLAFSPDGLTLASGAEDHTVRLLSLDGLRRAIPPSGESDDPSEVPVAQLAFFTSVPQILRLDGPVSGMSFDSRTSVLLTNDGKSIVGWGDDREGRSMALGSVESGGRVAVSRNGRWLVSGARLWNLESPRDGVSLISGRPTLFAQAAAGNWAADFGNDALGQRIRLWRMSDPNGPTPALRLSLPADVGYGRELRFDRDGHRLALRYDPHQVDGREVGMLTRVTRPDISRVAVWTLESLPESGDVDQKPIVTPVPTGVWDVSDYVIAYGEDGGPAINVVEGMTDPGVTRVQAADVPLESSFSEIRLSPDGRWLAALKRHFGPSQRG